MKEVLIMTLPMTVTSTCSICGTVSKQTRLASTNIIGSSDLDLRPPEMKRSTMWAWLEECPKCGYVAKTLSTPCPLPREFLQSDAYKTCDGIRFRSQLAPRFYRCHMIQLRTGSVENAMRRALEAAWLCDDARDTDNAILCRDLAAESMQTLRRESPEDETLAVRQLDILRRAGRFDDVLAAHAEIDLQQLPELHQKLVAFEVAKAKLHDAGRYTVADALS